MRDGPAPATWPMWAGRAVWSKRSAIFYALSAASFAGNALALAESLHVRASLTRLLHLLLPHLRHVGGLLQQRPVLYTLLNLLMLYLLLRSGLLAGRANYFQRQHHQDADQGRVMQEEVGGGWRKPSYLSRSNEDEGGGVTCQMSGKKKASSADLMACNNITRPNSKRSYISSEANYTDNDQQRPIVNVARRRASLFTIEPLRSEPTLSSPIVVAASKSNVQPSVVMACGDLLSTDVKPTRVTSPQANEDPHVASHWYHHRASPQDYDLNRHEFNARVEGFITKFKRNLTMQRENSLNRLLSLVGKR